MAIFRLFTVESNIKLICKFDSNAVTALGQPP